MAGLRLGFSRTEHRSSRRKQTGGLCKDGPQSRRETSSNHTLEGGRGPTHHHHQTTDFKNKSKQPGSDGADIYSSTQEADL